MVAPSQLKYRTLATALSPSSMDMQHGYDQGPWLPHSVQHCCGSGHKEPKSCSLFLTLPPSPPSPSSTRILNRPARCRSISATVPGPLPTPRTIKPLNFISRSSYHFYTDSTTTTGLSSNCTIRNPTEPSFQLPNSSPEHAYNLEREMGGEAAKTIRPKQKIAHVKHQHCLLLSFIAVTLKVWTFSALAFSPSTITDAICRWDIRGSTTCSNILNISYLQTPVLVLSQEHMNRNIRVRKVHYTTASNVAEDRGNFRHRITMHSRSA